MATRQIAIRGVILPAAYDMQWFAEDIDHGVITTENRFRAQLKEAADAGADVEVYVNSYGGDVVAGNEMLAAFQDYKGYKSVTIGAFAASMAANFVLQCGARVECHENTIVLFHSASTVAAGGAGALRDSAQMIDQINAPMMERLKALGVPADKVDEGFSEGRSFTLTAKELLEYGIVSKIVKGAAPMPVKAGASEKAENDLALAAFYDMVDAVESEDSPAEVETPEEQTAEPAKEDEEATEPEPETPAEHTTAPAEETAETPSETQTHGEAALHWRAQAEKSEANARKIQASASKRISDLTKHLMEMRREREASALNETALKQENANLRAQIETLRNELTDAKAQHARLVGNVLSTSDNKEPATWADAVKAFGLVEATRRYPKLADAFRNATVRTNH